MNGDRCEGCMFFRTFPNAPARTEQAVLKGECRARAPVFLPGGGTYGRWPVIEAGEWCGEFKPAPRRARTAPVKPAPEFRS